MKNCSFFESSKLRCSVLSRDMIKLMAMLTMLLNHFAHMFLDRGSQPYLVLTYIGYFTASVMCGFLVEGFFRTSDRRRYGLRLFVMALVSQVFYDMALMLGNLNMMFTLFACFLILACLEHVRDLVLRSLAVLVLVLLTFLTDWPVMAAGFTVILYAAFKSRDRIGVFIGYLCCYAFYIWFIGLSGAMGASSGLAAAAVSGLGIIFAGIAVAFLYSGRRAARCHKFLQHFFYWFYPAHLAVLAILRIFLY